MDSSPQNADLKKILSKEGLVHVLSALENTVSRANQLPPKSQLGILRATSTEIRKRGKSISQQVVSTIKQISSHYAVTVRQSDSDDDSSEDSFLSLTPNESVFDQTVEVTAEGLEHFNIALDDARGIQNANVAMTGALGPKDAMKLGLVKTGKKQLACLDIEKPQIHFPDYPIDNSDTPFVPPYQSASSSPQNEAEEVRSSAGAVQNYLQDLYKSNSTSERSTRHPYDEEIAASLQTIRERKLDPVTITVYRVLEKTPLTFINTKKQLFAAADRLKNATEIAVDLENHSVRSFQGFVCLMQISTRREDFVIDALALRGSINRALSPIFSDESTTKVLHGADRDVQWLERDFGIYVVNMFDTGQAARLLKFPSAALSYLLTRYCSLQTTLKKKFQLADWRVRPLPDEMLAYARSDTHYLLYIYDRLRSELSKASIVTKAWERSALVCRKRHMKIRYDAGMARQLAARHALGLDRHQILLFEELCRWRDVTAREEDESLVYIAPLNVIIGIVHARDSVRSVEGLITNGFPGGVVPPIIRQHAEKVVQLISDALDAKLKDNGTVDVEEKEPTDEPKSTKLADKAKSIPTLISKATSIFKVVGNESQSHYESNMVKDAILVSDETKSPEKESNLGKEEPSPSVSHLRKSSFLGSDSDSSSEEEVEGKEDHDTKKEMDGDCSNETGPCVARVREVVADPDMIRYMVEVAAEEEVQVKTSLQMDAVSRIQEELTASVRASIQPLETSAFDHDTQGMNSDVVEPASSSKPKHGEEGEEEVKVESLLETYGSQSKRARKRKRQKVKEQKKPVDEIELKPFDYKQAKLDDAKIEKQKREEFDPLRKLKREWKEDKDRAKKRRRGNGRSMTFKGAPLKR